MTQRSGAGKQGETPREKFKRALVTDKPERAAAALGEGGAILGLDLGEKTIGVAVSDQLRMTATPLETLKRGKLGADAIALGEIIARRDVVGIVLGLPRDMAGYESKRAQSTRAFARGLSERLAAPIWLWDERLSTVAVERTLLEADASRRRRAAVVDKMAAAFILQGALDWLRAAGGASPSSQGSEDEAWDAYWNDRDLEAPKRS